MCDYCGQYKDADVDGCIQSPFDEYGCICEDCAQKLQPMVKLYEEED